MPTDINNSHFGMGLPAPLPNSYLYNGDCERFLAHAKNVGKKFDLVFSSPPYNIGKSYAKYDDRQAMEKYIAWQTRVIDGCVERLTPNGSICWQVGMHVHKGTVLPLDFVFGPILKGMGLKYRNRIVWAFEHGLHCKRRFSGRYEVILWFSKSDDYLFNLDAVRHPIQKTDHRTIKNAEGDILGENPSDYWSVPNVKFNHVEKTAHPCQFPVALVQRFLLALTKPGDCVFDPFLGAGTTAAAAAQFKRKFYGCEIDPEYFAIARRRVDLGLRGILPFRDANKPVASPPAKKRLTVPLKPTGR
jgi:adenine-specific DNA-methyltransferase